MSHSALKLKNTSSNWSPKFKQCVRVRFIWIFLLFDKTEYLYLSTFVRYIYVYFGFYNESILNLSKVPSFYISWTRFCVCGSCFNSCRWEKSGNYDENQRICWLFQMHESCGRAGDHNKVMKFVICSLTRLAVWLRCLRCFFHV